MPQFQKLGSFYQRFLFQILFNYKIMFLTSSVEGAITKDKVTSFTHEFYWVFTQRCCRKAQTFFTVAFAELKNHCMLVWLWAFLVFWQTCEENRLVLTTSLKCVALCCQISSLFCTVARFFEENASKLPKVSEASHEVDGGSLTTANALGSPTNIFTEWQEFFSGTLFNAVLQLFLFHAGERRLGLLFWSKKKIS